MKPFLTLMLEELIHSMMINFPESYRTVLMMHVLKYLEVESIHEFMEIKIPSKKKLLFFSKKSVIAKDDPQKWKITHAVRDIMVYIQSFDDKSLTGIFRLSGCNANVKVITSIVKSTQKFPQIFNGFGIQDSACALKRLLRTFEPSVIPLEFIETVKTISQKLTENDKLTVYSILIRLMPRYIQCTILNLFSFLYLISKRSPNMNSKNLAIIFTPTLFPIDYDLTNDFDNCINMIEFMIKNGDKLYKLPEKLVDYLTDVFKNELRGKQNEIGFWPINDYTTKVINERGKGEIVNGDDTVALTKFIKSQDIDCPILYLEKLSNPEKEPTPINVDVTLKECNFKTKSFPNRKP